MQRNGYCRFSSVTVADSSIDVVLRINWHQMWWPGWCPTRLHQWTMLIPPLTLVCFFGISGLWLQDRTIRQLKEEAQHLSTLGVRHIMWGLDGLVLACLWRLCILSDTVLVFSVFVFLLLRRCILLVVLRATVVKRESRKNMPKAFAWPSMLGCTSYLRWYNVVYGMYMYVYLFYRSFNYFQRGQEIST